jgi:hypothetical protein
MNREIIVYYSLQILYTSLVCVFVHRLENLLVGLQLVFFFSPLQKK